MSVFRFDAERSFRPCRFGANPRAIAAHVHMIEIRESRKCFSLYAVQTFKHSASGHRRTEISVAKRLRKERNRSQRFPANPCGIGSARCWNTVDSGVLSIVAKDASLVIQAITLQQTPLDHESPLASGRKRV